MLRAIIFDFNGVILNDEPLHFLSMRDAVASVGITITKEEYWSQYLPLDDWRCIAAICSNHSVKLTEEQRERALRLKSEYYLELLQNPYPLFPGAVDLVRSARIRYPLALASGAHRSEIEPVLAATGLSDCFDVIVAAEDFVIGKPHPESYLLTLKLLNARLDGGTGTRIQPHECLVVEDSAGGVRGARAAGMMCLAVSNTYPREKLDAAHMIVDSLENVTLDSLQSLFVESS